MTSQNSVRFITLRRQPWRAWYRSAFQLCNDLTGRQYDVDELRSYHYILHWQRLFGAPEDGTTFETFLDDCITNTYSLSYLPV